MQHMVQEESRNSVFWCVCPWFDLLRLLLHLVPPTLVFSPGCSLLLIVSFTWLDWHLLLYLLHLFHLVELAPTVGCTYCTWVFTWFFTWLDLLWCCSPGWTGRFPLFAAAISRRSRLPCRKGLLQVIWAKGLGQNPKKSRKKFYKLP